MIRAIKIRFAYVSFTQGQGDMGKARPPFWYGHVLVIALATLPICIDPLPALGKGQIEIVPTLGHSAGVSSVAFSPNGARVLSCSGDKTLKLWDSATGA